MLEVINKEAIRRNVCSNLTRILKERDLSFSELSRQTGINVMTISQTVRGVSVPSIAVIAAVAQALGRTVDEIISDPPHVHRPKRKMAGRRQLVESR